MMLQTRLKGHGQRLEVVPLAEGVQGTDPFGAVGQVIKPGSHCRFDHVGRIGVTLQVDKTAPEKLQQITAYLVTGRVSLAASSSSDLSISPDNDRL